MTSPAPSHASKRSRDQRSSTNSSTERPAHKKATKPELDAGKLQREFDRHFEHNIYDDLATAPPDIVHVGADFKHSVHVSGTRTNDTRPVNYWEDLGIAHWTTTGDEVRNHERVRSMLQHTCARRRRRGLILNESTSETDVVKAVALTVLDSVNIALEERHFREGERVIRAVSEVTVRPEGSRSASPAPSTLQVPTLGGGSGSGRGSTVRCDDLYTYGLPEAHDNKKDRIFAVIEYKNICTQSHKTRIQAFMDGRVSPPDEQGGQSQASVEKLAKSMQKADDSRSRSRGASATRRGEQADSACLIRGDANTLTRQAANYAISYKTPFVAVCDYRSVMLWRFDELDLQAQNVGNMARATLITWKNKEDMKLALLGFLEEAYQWKTRNENEGSRSRSTSPPDDGRGRTGHPSQGSQHDLPHHPR